MKVMAVDGKGVDTSFFHTDYMVLIDKNRNIRGYYHGLDTAALAKLSNDIVLLSLEKDPKRKRFFEGNLELIAVAFFFALLGVGLLLYFTGKNKTHGA
jgi:protein SCO1